MLEAGGGREICIHMNNCPRESILVNPYLADLLAPASIRSRPRVGRGIFVHELVLSLRAAKYLV